VPDVTKMQRFLKFIYQTNSKKD